ncbi:MAG: hypothetical protein Q9162_004006 [Coniocarpon cinnabarinum]
MAPSTVLHFTNPSGKAFELTVPYSIEDPENPGNADLTIAKKIHLHVVFENLRPWLLRPYYRIAKIYSEGPDPIRDEEHGPHFQVDMLDKRGKKLYSKLVVIPEGVHEDVENEPWTYGGRPA